MPKLSPDGSKVAWEENQSRTTLARLVVEMAVRHVSRKLNTGVWEKTTVRLHWVTAVCHAYTQTDLWQWVMMTENTHLGDWIHRRNSSLFLSPHLKCPSISRLVKFFFFFFCIRAMLHNWPKSWDGGRAQRKHLLVTHAAASRPTQAFWAGAVILFLLLL